MRAFFVVCGSRVYLNVCTESAIAGLTTVLIVSLYGQSRILFAMSRDGLVPPIFSQVHDRFRTPFYCSAILGVVVAAVAAVGRLDTVADLVNVGTLFAFALVSIGVIVLRRLHPNIPRGFRVPLGPLLPLLSAVGAVALILKGLPERTLLAFAVWMIAGLVLYFVYGFKRS